MLLALPAPPPTSVAFWDARHGLVARGTLYTTHGRGEVDLTTDGGRTFRVVLRTRARVASVAVAGRGDAWAVVDRCSATGCKPSALLHSGDGGRSWRRIAVGVVAAPSFSDARHGVGLAAFTFTGPNVSSALVSTSDGGRTWRRASSPCRRVAMAPVGVAAPTPSRWWIACAGGAGAGAQLKAVFASRDGGRSWDQIAVATMAPRRVRGGIAVYGYPQGIAVARDGFGLLWESRGTLYSTRDGGSHWSGHPTVAKPELDFGVSASAVAGGAGFVLLSGNGGVRLVATSDRGRTWRLVRRL